jgi:ribonuclease HI
MELRALIELLESSDPTEGLRISVDSQYVMKIFTEWLPRWRERGMRTSKNKPVENIDLIERADGLLTDRQIEFEWVRGHDGHPMNEHADRLANAAAVRAREKLRRGA